MMIEKRAFSFILLTADGFSHDTLNNSVRSSVSRIHTKCIHSSRKPVPSWTASPSPRQRIRSSDGGGASIKKAKISRQRKIHARGITCDDVGVNNYRHTHYYRAGIHPIAYWSPLYDRSIFNCVPSIPTVASYFVISLADLSLITSSDL